MNGYAGKILRLNLTDRKVGTIPTSQYQHWLGGHGMGSAIFFDLVKDKTIDGLDPTNVVTMMTSPLSGTLVPAASGRTEVQGIGVQSYPIGWFTRSNLGGRFSGMLKFAGWDGVVIQGKADKPAWIDIRDGDVQIRDCAPLSLWGTETWDCQEIIWEEVAAGGKYGDWNSPSGKEGGKTTQRPAVVAIGPAGENQSRLACLIHDASNAAGQGGFGAVFGSKNLKAISVIGTVQVEINDPKMLIATRLWQKENYAFHLAHLKETWGSFRFQSPPAPIILWAKGRPKIDQRPQACMGCHSGCRARYKDARGNEASCISSVFYWIKWDVSNAKSAGSEPSLTAEEVVKIVTDKMVPFQGDLDMLDFSEKNIYSEHMAKMVSWHRYYTRFWKQSMLFCDVRWPDFVNIHRPDNIGSTGIAEPKYVKAVTGKDFSFREGIDLGLKIWNLDHAIWTLQGRHRDMVHFVDNVYEKRPLFPADVPNAYMPGKEDGKWDYYGYSRRTLDKDKFDEFKTRFYRLQGWDESSGYPNRSTLESLELGYVADELDRNNKIGKE